MSNADTARTPTDTYSGGEEREKEKEKKKISTPHLCGPWRRPLALALGIAPDAVTDAVRRGCPAPTLEDWTDRSATVITTWCLWLRTHRPAWAARHLRPLDPIDLTQAAPIQASLPLGGGPAAGAGAGPVADDPESWDRRRKLRAEADHAEHKRDLAAVELATKRGELVSRAEALALVRQLEGSAIAELQSLPGLLAQQLPIDQREIIRAAGGPIAIEGAARIRTAIRSTWRAALPVTAPR